MIDGKSVLAVITARSGSKRLPNKNIIDFCGKPLIFWTIQAALECNYVDRLIISTDSTVIGEIASGYGCEFPFIRPKGLSDDTASSTDVMLHAIDWLQNNDAMRYDYIILLQPTSPLRSSQHLKAAIEMMNSNPNSDSLISVKKIEKNLEWFLSVTASGHLSKYFTKETVAGEEVRPPFIPNGAIYISRIDSFLAKRTFLSDKCIPFIMNSFESVDIDTEEDFKLAAFYKKL